MQIAYESINAKTPLCVGTARNPFGIGRNLCSVSHESRISPLGAETALDYFVTLFLFHVNQYSNNEWTFTPSRGGMAIRKCTVQQEKIASILDIVYIWFAFKPK